jgi:hypothetical protein
MRALSSPSNLVFYLARAEQARVEAEAASLLHVRERCERSEAAWTALAERAQRGERLRELELSRKATTVAT